MELATVKRGSKNYFILQKLFSVADNTSLQSVIRPLGAVPDALDMLGDCASEATRCTLARRQSYISAGVR